MFKKQFWCVCALASALAGCGGGSSTPAVTSSTLTLSGTAASGLAIADGAVSAKCQAGTGAATTGSDGSFTLTVADGTLPCVLRISAAGGTVLHSMIEGSGSSATVNITPLSDMMVARLAGTTPEAFFTAFDPSKVTPAAVTDAQSAVVKALKGVVDLSGMDLLSDKLQAASSGTSGDAFDQKLDTLQSKLSAVNTPLSTIVQALADNSDASTDGAGSVVATLLQQPSSSCPSLRSGEYRVITPALAAPAYIATFDAQSLGISYLGTSGTGVAVSGEPCAFANQNDSSRFYFSKSGIVVVNNRNLDRISFAFPIQTLTLADLTGTWNTMSFERGDANSPYTSSHGIETITADGSASASDCAQAITQSACPAATNAGSFAAAASGDGFIYTPSGSSSQQQAFAYRAPNGNMALVVIGSNNSIVVATRQTANTLPALGDVQKFWDIKVGNASGLAGTTSDVSLTISAVDAATDSFSRTFSDNSVDSFTINKPYTGMNYRASGVRPEIVAMHLHGLGIVVYATTETDSTGYFGVRIDKP